MHIDEDELVFVTKVTSDKPVIHRFEEAQVPTLHLATLCTGKPLSFRFKDAVMPYKHAHLFAGLCQACRLASIKDNGGDDGE